MRIKRSELFFSVLLVPLDYILVIAAGIAVHALRFTTFADVIPVYFELTLQNFLSIALPAGIAWTAFYALLGLYTVSNMTMPQRENMKVFVGSTAAVAFFIFIIFFRQELFASRFIILVSWILSSVFVIFGRTIVRLIYRHMLRSGLGARNIAVITTEDDMHGLVRTFSEHPEFGFFVQRQFASFDVSAESAMKDLVNASELDEIFLARPHLDEEMLQRLVSFCSEHHVTFRYVADVAPIPLSHVEIASIAGIPIIEVKRTSLEGWGRVWKRLFDVVFSSLGLIILSPFFGIISLLIKLDTEGPAIKSLVRIGEKGKPFSVYKFRSMVKDAEKLKEQLLAYNERNDGPLFKMKNDPRITRMGKFLRATSIDELPQLWNVFRGDMSMVGPRPHEPREVAKYSLMQKKLLTLKPGMTGLAQVSGRSGLKFEQEAQLDIYYIEHWSMVRDISILLRTPSAVLMRRNAV